jgi:hypothetical protein
MPEDTAIRPYDLMCELAVREDVIPDGETLAEMSSALGAVQEFFTDRAKRAVVRVVNENNPGSVTFEDIGRLVTWADHMRDQAETIIQDVEKVLIVMRESAWALADGSTADGSPFNDYGFPDDYEQYEHLRKRQGFGG